VFVITRRRSKRRAEAVRMRFVEAQRVVDQVWLRMYGVPVQPPADEAYSVVADRNQWAVVINDPSL
jgi:hypothetical protein